MRLFALLAASALHAGVDETTIIDLDNARVEAVGVSVDVTRDGDLWVIRVKPK